MTITKLYRKIKDFCINVKNKLSNHLESTIVFNIKNKNDEVSSLKCLKILDNTDYLTKNTSIKWSKYIANALIIAILIIFFLNIDKIIRPQFGIIYGLFSLFLLTVLVLLAYNFLILFISYLFKYFYNSCLKNCLKIRRLLVFLSFVKILRIKLFITMIVNAFIISFLLTISMLRNSDKSSLIKKVFMEYDLNKIFTEGAWSFWLIFFVVSIASCLSFDIVLKSQNIFELEDMESENRFILAILAIVTFIIGFDIDKVRLIGIALLILVIQTAFFEFRQSQLLSKMYEKAQEVFQEQLLFDNPDYQELKRCYFHGGEKYKEKLLSTEKFLVVIVKNELKSLKDLKTYDNYRLYKAIRARNL